MRRQASVDNPRYPPQSAPQAQPPSQLQQPFQPSDYESDNQGYASDYPTTLPPAGRTNDELNLSVLQRYCPEVSLILSIAPYAVIYEFQPLPDPTWIKTGVEGSLFICQLTAGLYGEDRYMAIVLNRRGMDNFEAELREGENAGVDITDDYVIISSRQDHEQKIYGVFIFSEGPGTSTEHTRTANAELMKTLAGLAGASKKAGEDAAAAANAVHTHSHMHQAELVIPDGVPAAGQQISLLQLFGQQRTNDASFSVRAHQLDGAGEMSAQPDFNRAQTQALQAQPPQQQDVLGDLFRRAGLSIR